MIKLPLPTDDSMDLQNLCLMSAHIHYYWKHYKQLHRTAMGSQVSVVVAEIVNVEHRGTSPSNLQMDTTALVMT